MKKIMFLIMMILFFTPITSVEGKENNKVGVHIINDSDIKDAASLVNSNGGDWGYVTLVIREDEINMPRYERLFREFKIYHLTPIVRIATTQTPSGWSKPDENSIEKWVNFFESLSWPTENRYIIVGNEPNHAKEWGGSLSPSEYASYLRKVSIALKSRSDTYFILPAGLDASAPNSSEHMDEELFIKWMLAYDHNLFEHVDGWNSHSYPNPAFSGSVEDKGRGTIRTYEWELDLIRSLGVTKHLPVFITETGWVHNTNGIYPWLITDKEAGDRLKYAYENVWDDNRIIAVTPFVLNYSSEPFVHFSMKDINGNFNAIFRAISDLVKHSGSPYIAAKNSYDNFCLEGTESTAMSIDPGFYLTRSEIGARIW